MENGNENSCRRADIQYMQGFVEQLRQVLLRQSSDGYSISVNMMEHFHLLIHRQDPQYFCN